MLTADERCHHPSCHEKNVYRMVGRCRNCGAEPVLIIYSATHPADRAECPTCGVRDGVEADRLASEDEIPVA